jgi:hypothetical protein
MDGGGGIAPQCPPAEVLCEGTCTDISSDAQNCGQCGNACMGSDACSAGVCGGTSMCPPGLIECGGCYDVSNDPEFCGSCMPYQCADSQFCQDGTCQCRPGLTECGGECVDTESNPDHCGGCDTPCAQSCVAGECVDANQCDQTDCNGACVDTDTNTLHCGGCDSACAVDQICINGQCFDYAANAECDACDGCTACPSPEVCCDLGDYGIACVDTTEPCP